MTFLAQRFYQTSVLNVVIGSVLQRKSVLDRSQPSTFGGFLAAGVRHIVGELAIQVKSVNSIPCACFLDWVSYLMQIFIIATIWYL